MGSMPYALSIHNFISSVGADAGFASIIGLAILVLLYFAHARETSALRDQAAELAARLQDAEARLVQATRAGTAVGPGPQVAQPPVVSPPAGAAAPATAAGAVRVIRTSSANVAAPPFAPACVAAPAVATATRFVPVSSPVGSPVPQPAPPLTAAPQPAAPLTTAPAQPAPAAAQTPGEPLQPFPLEPAPAEPAEVPAEPVAAPVAAPAATLPAPQTVAGAANGGAEHSAGVLSPPRQIPSRPVERSGPPRRPYAPLTPPPRRGSSSRRVGAMLIGALVVIGAIAALVVATSGSGTPAKSGGARTSNAPQPARPKVTFNPAAVTVSVLNGTAVNHLASKTAQRLTSMGYKEGRVTDAADQTHTTTVVAYLPGFRADALHVARALGLGQTAVQPVDQGSQQVACPGAGTCTANVVVTVGADLATS